MISPAAMRLTTLSSSLRISMTGPFVSAWCIEKSRDYPIRPDGAQHSRDDRAHISGLMTLDLTVRLWTCMSNFRSYEQGR